MLRNWLLSAFFLLFSLPLAAQTTASAALDSNFAETGNPFIIHLSVPKAAGGEPQDIDFKSWDSAFPTENRLALSAWDDRGTQHTAQLTLIAFDADTLTLPPLAIRLRGGGKALTNPLQVVILPTPSPDDLVDMAPIEDIRHEPTRWTDYWPWAVGALGILLLLGLLFWQAARLGRKKKAAVSRSIEIPPHTLALRRLEALTDKRLWQQGRVKDYYAELTHILRQFLEQRYHIPALESTSDILLDRLSHTAFFSENQLFALRELLTQADLAKFAKSEPPTAYHHQAWQIVRQVVTAAIEPETEPMETV